MRQSNLRARRYAGPGSSAVKKKPEREVIPGVTVRCECGRVVRCKRNGDPIAHNYCPWAPPTY